MKIGLNIKLGIIAGLINCIAWYYFALSFTFYSLNIEQYRYYVTLLLLLMGIFISVFFERKKNKGFIEFKDAVKYGIIYTITLAIILAIFNYLYYKFIAIDAIDYFVNEAKKVMIIGKVKNEDIVKNLENVKSYFGSFRVLMSTIILGVLFSLLAGAIFRKKDPHVFSAN